MFSSAVFYWRMIENEHRDHQSIMSLSKSSTIARVSSSNVPLRSQKTGGILASNGEKADWKTANHWCDSCNKGFPRGPYLLRHWQQMHIFEKECILCNAHLDDAEPVYYHMNRVHRAKKFYSCTCCKWVFIEEEDLRKHEKSISQHGLPGTVRPVMKLTVKNLHSTKKQKSVQPPSVAVQGKSGPRMKIAGNIEAPRKMHTDPNIKQVMSAGSLYPALFVRIGPNPEMESAKVSNSMKVLNSSAQKNLVGEIPSKEAKRGTAVLQAMDEKNCSTEGFMGKKAWNGAEKDAYNMILATLMLGPQKIKPTSFKPTTTAKANMLKTVNKAMSGNGKNNAFKLPKLQKTDQVPGNLVKHDKKK